jgi:hypothetical protein
MSQTGFKNLIGSKDGKGIYWTTDVNDELPIKINPGSRNDFPAYCIHDFVNEKRTLRPDFTAYVCKR